ncbi:MAG TPA: TlpA disulfide reductase family protein [Pontibacter sp.]
MKNKLLALGLCFVGSLISVAALAQGKFTATIQLSPQLDPEDVTVYYDNGKELIQVESEFKAGKLIVSETYFSKYATIELSYPSPNPIRSYYKAFFISDKPATIRFTPTTVANNPLASYKLKNAYDIDSKGKAKMETFISAEERDFFEFLDANQTKFGESDSLVKVLFQKSERLALKKAEYIKKHANEYYSFWLFRREIAGNKLLVADSLLATFNHAFPAEFKNSAEGIQVAKVLRGMNIKKGQPAPDFFATDERGKEVRLTDFKGKFVLINFWASWCKPCLEEMPVIVEMKEKYPEKLEVVFITLDSNADLAAKAVEKYRMSGIHIRGNADLVATYGAQAIPVVYLVDPEGNVIYSRHEEGDPQLQQLPGLLQKRI